MPERLLNTHAGLWRVQGKQEFSEEQLTLIAQVTRILVVKTRDYAAQGFVMAKAL